jgi:hypothetical protein
MPRSIRGEGIGLSQWPGFEMIALSSRTYVSPTATLTVPHKRSIQCHGVEKIAERIADFVKDRVLQRHIQKINFN